ncbi:MAG: PilZ domain-containing protein [Planctomycetota bacterium]
MTQQGVRKPAATNRPQARTPKKGSDDASSDRQNSLGFSRGQVRAVVDEMNRIGQSRAGAKNTPGGIANRKYARWNWTSEQVPVELDHPGGSRVRVQLAARNLSAGGIALLHSGFVHPGTHAKVLLIAPSGDQLAIDGKVRRCSHIAGMVHELGVAFNNPIDLKCVAPPENEWFTLEKVDPEQLTGRIVLIGGTELGRKVFRNLLRNTGMRVAEVASAEEGASAVGDGCDVLISDVTAQLDQATELNMMLQAEGVRLNSIALYRNDNEASVTASVALDPTLRLSSPVKERTLHLALGEILLVGNDEVGNNDMGNNAA